MPMLPCSDMYKFSPTNSNTNNCNMIICNLDLKLRRYLFCSGNAFANLVESNVGHFATIKYSSTCKNVKTSLTDEICC